MIRKIRLILKFTTQQPGERRFAINLLSNISRSKGNLTMKFGQLTEYTMKNIFLEKSSKSALEKLFPFFPNFVLYSKGRILVSKGLTP